MEIFKTQGKFLIQEFSRPQQPSKFCKIFKVSSKLRPISNKIHLVKLNSKEFNKVDKFKFLRLRWIPTITKLSWTIITSRGNFSITLLPLSRIYKPNSSSNTSRIVTSKICRWPSISSSNKICKKWWIRTYRNKNNYR